MVRETFKKLPENKRLAIINSAITEFSKTSYAEAGTDEIRKIAAFRKGYSFTISGAKRNSIVTA